MSHVPRTTLAQNMDALSSQSNIAGYKAILIGACHIEKYMPLLMTAAGTISAAKVLIETDLKAEEIARKSIKVASDICVFTNNNITVEKI